MHGLEEVMGRLYFSGLINNGRSDMPIIGEGALGNRRRRVVEMIILENTVIVFAGAIPGVLLGIGLALLISAIGIPRPPPPNSDLSYVAHIRIIWPVIGGVFVVGVFATIAAALLPAARVYRIPAVEALRENV